MPVFCKDCRHFIVPETGIQFARCAMTRTYNLVTGEEEFQFCNSERCVPHANVPHICGSEGSRFEPAVQDDPASFEPYTPEF